VTLSVPVPTSAGEAPVPFDAEHVAAAEALATAVVEVNDRGDFPLVLGGDHTAMLGHLLGHSRRHPRGFGLALLAEPQLDLCLPEEADIARCVLAGALGRFPEGSALADMLRAVAVSPAQTTVAGVRGEETKREVALEQTTGIDVWRMERIELDGEQAYRSVLERNLSRGPIALSIDARGIDPHLMAAVNDPVPDGLDWSFLKRSLEQCLPHVDRILGLDICELDPLRDEAHGLSQVRFAEAVAPFLRKITR
jgi:arginase